MSIQLRNYRALSMCPMCKELTEVNEVAKYVRMCPEAWISTMNVILFCSVPQILLSFSISLQ